MTNHGGPRPGAGRPKSANPRTATIYAKVTRDEKATIEDRAAVAGVSLSEYVRARVLR
jgi:uncharacterized protein (DUF1778 family)